MSSHPVLLKFIYVSSIFAKSFEWAVSFRAPCLLPPPQSISWSCLLCSFSSVSWMKEYTCRTHHHHINAAKRQDRCCTFVFLPVFCEPVWFLFFLERLPIFTKRFSWTKSSMDPFSDLKTSQVHLCSSIEPINRALHQRERRLGTPMR